MTFAHAVPARRLPVARILRGACAALALASGAGCASVKKMTGDFEAKWEDPSSIMKDMEAEGGEKRALDASAGQAAAGPGDCLGLYKVSKLGELKDQAEIDAAILAGECFLGVNDAEARRTFERVVAASPENSSALQGLGVAFVRLGDHADAKPSLERAVAIDATLWRSWNALGVALDGLGSAPEAWPHFEKAAELSGDDGAPLNNLGVSLMRAGKNDEAVAALTRALERREGREAAEANLRIAFALLGDYANATKGLPDQKRAIALNNAGVAAASRGDTDAARALFQRALDESPYFYGKAYNNMTLLLQ